jgi:vancomycin permeability regulator SanA
VFGYGQKLDGNIDEQTQDRCRKALSQYRKGLIKKIYLTVSASSAGVSMADSMQRFLVSEGIPSSKIIIVRRGGNTAGELDVFLAEVPEGEKLLLISTWYHILRIAWLALWRIPFKQFRLAVAWKHAHFKADVLMEFAKLVNAILRPRRSSKTFSNPPAIT